RPPPGRRHTCGRPPARGRLTPRRAPEYTQPRFRGRPGPVPEEENPMRHLAMATVAVLVLAAAARTDEEKVPLDKVPKAVLDSAKKRFPKAEVKGASKEGE